MSDGRRRGETAELRRLRRRIDALDRRIVGLLNERAELARDVGREKVGARAAGGPRRGARARGAAPGHDGERRADAPGRPPRDLPAADRRRPGARDAGPRAASTRERHGDRAGRAPDGRSPSAVPQATADVPGGCGRGDVDRTPVRAGADRLPPSRPRRERALGLGRRAARRRAGCCSGSRTTTGSAAGPSSTRALLEDLAWLGFVADEPRPTLRQSDPDAAAAYPVGPCGRLNASGPRVPLRLHARDVRGVGARTHGATGRAAAARAACRDAGSRRRHGRRPPGGARRRHGAWTTTSSAAVPGPVARRGRSRGPRPARQLDVWVLRRRRRPSSGRRPRRPRRGPASRRRPPRSGSAGCSAATSRRASSTTR